MIVKPIVTVTAYQYTLAGLGVVCGRRSARRRLKKFVRTGVLSQYPWTRGRPVFYTMGWTP